MNRIQTLKSNYKVVYKLENKPDSSFFFETLKEAKEFREQATKQHSKFEVYPKLIMLSSSREYDFVKSVYKDKWI